MERTLPGLRLSWTIADEGGFTPAPLGDARATATMSGGGMQVFCNGNRDHLVTITGWETPAFRNAGGKPQFEVHAKWPLDVTGVAAAGEVLEEVSEGGRAFWAHVTPEDAAGDIAEQTSSALAGPPPPRGLPALKLPWNIRLPEIPHRLGWLNYWSAAAAEVLGFPDKTRDTDLLSRSRRSATGGWIVRLTDAPLDLDNPAHLDVLLRAYERFPQIGGRATP